MSDLLHIPQTLHEAIKHFSDPNVAHNFFVTLRWPGGVTCPYCGCDRLSFIRTRRSWACKDCKKRFTVKNGTIMEDSPLKLETWAAAMWLIAGAKNGISSCEIARALGVCQKTAWFLLHRIRYAMTHGSMEKFTGTVEADECYVGGLEKNKHKGKKLNKGRGGVGKEIVMGILERSKEKGSSRVRVKVISNTTKATLHSEVKANVEPGSEIFTDAHLGYRGLSQDLEHAWVDHAVKYVEGQVHTNGMENFWSLFSRMLGGTYTHIDPRHLQSYVDEQVHRFNNRKEDDRGRFNSTMRGLDGKRLTYAQLKERPLSFTQE